MTFRTKFWSRVTSDKKAYFNRRFGVPGKLTIARRQQWRCASKRCAQQGHPLPQTFFIDHKRPLFDGGTNEEENLHAICESSYDIKSNQDRRHYYSIERYYQRNPLIASIENPNFKFIRLVPKEHTHEVDRLLYELQVGRKFEEMCDSPIPNSPERVGKSTIELKRLEFQKLYGGQRRTMIPEKQDWKCVCKQCAGKVLLPSVFHLDHIKPLSEGGSNDPNNIQAICPNSHAVKTSRENQEMHRAERDIKEIQVFNESDHCGFILTRFVSIDNIDAVDKLLRKLKYGKPKKKETLKPTIHSKYFKSRNDGFITD